MKVRNVVDNEPMLFQGNKSVVSGREALARLLEGYLQVNLGEIWIYKTTGIDWLSILRDGEPDGVIFAIKNALYKFKRAERNAGWGITQISVDIIDYNVSQKKLKANVTVNSSVGEVNFNVKQ